MTIAAVSPGVPDAPEIDTPQPAAALLPGVRDDALAEAVMAALGADPTLSQTGVAGTLGVSQSQFSQRLRGIYRGDNGSMNARIRKWLSMREEQAAMARALPEDIPYYRTETSQRVWTRLTLAHHAPDIAVIDGAAGVGKTRTAQEYADSYPAVWMVTMSPDCSGVLPALEEVAIAMDLQVQGGAAAHRRAVLKRIKASNGPSLINIDEAQHLSTAAFDELRTLHDRGATGIAYIGNEGVWAQMVGGGRKGQALDRVHSRIGARAHCTGATSKDIAALLDAWDISDRAARSIVSDIARRPGALRAATKVIRSAHLYAAGSAIGAEHLRAARAGRGI